MLILLITVTLTLPQPTDADLNYMGALLCGETCGMGRECMEFVASQLRHDWYLMGGTHRLDDRWYAPLKPNREATRIVRDAFKGNAIGGERCRLIGNSHDVIYWSRNGYLELGAVADYYWESGGMSILAFDCSWREYRIVRWTCEGERCPR